MAKYEIWGPDEASRQVLLAYANGDLPDVGDTIVVRSRDRDIIKVWRHHAGPLITHRVGVGEPIDADPGT